LFYFLSPPFFLHYTFSLTVFYFIFPFCFYTSLILLLHLVSNFFYLFCLICFLFLYFYLIIYCPIFETDSPHRAQADLGLQPSKYRNCRCEPNHHTQPSIFNYLYFSFFSLHLHFYSVFNYITFLSLSLPFFLLFPFHLL
jgi:hypothetical protein